MGSKKLASSKSKSQGFKPRVCCFCGSQDHTSVTLCRDYWKSIANAPTVKSEPLSEPEACQGASVAADVVISRNTYYHCWFIRAGSHLTTILDEEKKPFSDRDDALTVAKYLASKTAGPINVIWW